MNIAPSPFWVTQHKGFTAAEATAFVSLSGTDPVRITAITRATRVLAVELAPSGIRRFMILNGLYYHLSGRILASYGINPRVCAPVVLAEGLATQGFTSVCWKSRAQAEGFVSSPTALSDWLRPDGATFDPHESGLPDTSGDPNDTATVTIFPKAVMLTANAPDELHHRPVLQALTGDERTQYPELAPFMDAVWWLETNNAAKSLGATTTYLDWKAIDITPFDGVIDRLDNIPTVDIDGILPTEDVHEEYVNHYNKLYGPSAPPLGVPRMAHGGGQVAAAPTADATAPAALPTAPVNTADAVLTTALIEALQGTRRSTTEQESFEERTQAGTVLRLLFSRLISNTTLQLPGTTHLSHVVALPELRPEFVTGVLKPTKNVQATRNLSQLYEATEALARNLGPNAPHLIAIHQARGTLVTEFFTAQIRAGEYSIKAMEQYRSTATTTVSLLLFAPPKYTAAQYEDHLEHGRKIQLQVQQGEDPKNQAKKATTHNPIVNIQNRQDYSETVAAIWAFERMTVEHDQQLLPEQPSHLISLLQQALEHLCQSSDAAHWFLINQNCTNAFAHIFMIYQNIFRDMAAFAKHPAVLQAVAAAHDNIIADPMVIERLLAIQTAALHSLGIASSKLLQAIPSDWLVASPVAEFFSTNHGTHGGSTPDKTRNVSPDSSQGSPSKKPRFGSNAPSTPTGQPVQGEKVTLSPEERTRRESKGLFTILEGCQDKRISIGTAVKTTGTSNARYICQNYTIVGRACAFAKCTRLHLNSMKELEPTSAQDLRKAIKDSGTLRFTNRSDDSAAPASQASPAAQPMPWIRQHPSSFILPTNSTELTMRTILVERLVQSTPAPLPPSSRSTTSTPTNSNPYAPTALPPGSATTISTTQQQDISTGETSSSVVRSTTTSSTHPAAPPAPPEATDASSQHHKKQSREAWATTQMPAEISSQLWNIHGKEVNNLTFSSPLAFRHILPHLFSSQFMARNSRNALCAACPLAREYSTLLRRYRNVDFTPLQAGLPPPASSQHPTESIMMQSFTSQVTACFLYHNCWTPHVIRYIGGQHTGGHRDWRSIRNTLRTMGVRDEITKDLMITLRQGAPRFFNSEFTDSNFRAALDYGNHPSINASAQHTIATKASLTKDIRKGFAICANPRLLFFVPHVHLTPMGLIVVPSKKPRIYFDSSFRPKIWSMAINDVTDASKEPDIHFAGAFVEQLAWIWNLRITYPTDELYIGDDDVSGAFRQVKYHPNMVSLHSCLIFGHLFMYTGQTFGDAPSPPNWEPIVTARKALAQKFWLDNVTTETAGRAVLPDIDLGPDIHRKLDGLPVPTSDTINRGVLDATNAMRLPPPYPHHVDDCYYADIGRYFYRTVVSSLLALYTILGKPSPWNTDVVSWEKFTSTFTHERRINGWLVNSRNLTLTLPDDKRQRLLDLLREWAEVKRVFTIRELAVLLGTLTDHSRPLPWFRARYAILFHLLGDTLRRRHRAMQHYNRRKQIRTTAAASLPPNLHYRLNSIVATEVAAALWQSKQTMVLSDTERTAIGELAAYARSSTRSWTGTIGHMIPRDPDFESYGDASLAAGGGYNTTLRFYFVLGWGPKITQGLHLPPAHPNFRHINDLEFIVIIMQLAATLVWIDDNQWTGIAPLILIWTDNTSSKAWAAAVHARSPRLHGLVSLYADLLERGNFKPQTAYIASADNHQADFLSRLDPHLSPPLLHSQISQQYIDMNSFKIFHPASALLHAIEARMFSDAPPAHLEPTTNLGRFAAGGSPSSNSWLG